MGYSGLHPVIISVGQGGHFIAGWDLVLKKKKKELVHRKGRGGEEVTALAIRSLEHSRGLRINRVCLLQEGFEHWRKIKRF